MSIPIGVSVNAVDEDVGPTDRECYMSFGQVEYKRAIGANLERLLEKAGFSVEVISGAKYPKEILPVIGPADYDMNILFNCRKNNK